MYICTHFYYPLFSLRCASSSSCLRQCPSLAITTRNLTWIFIMSLYCVFNFSLSGNSFLLSYKYTQICSKSHIFSIDRSPLPSQRHLRVSVCTHWSRSWAADTVHATLPPGMCPLMLYTPSIKRCLTLASSRGRAGTDWVREAQRRMEWALKRWKADRKFPPIHRRTRPQDCPAQDWGGQSGIGENSGSTETPGRIGGERTEL